MDPFIAHENALGFTAVRLHYSADPSKDADWAVQARRAYPDPNQWAREMEISWWVAEGTRVYPEFSEQVHCRDLSHRPRKVIYRAWDFGYLAPACLIAQIDQQDRLMVLREVIGHEETTKLFAERVLSLCAGWYPHHVAGFQDFCDPAGQQRKSTSESSEVQDVQILNNLGVYPTWEFGWTRKHGRALVHQLLQTRLDGSPGFYVDPVGAPVLVQGFLGKYVYPPKKGGQAHDEPDESNHPWADAHACLRYLATGLYSALGLRRVSQSPEPPREITWHGYGSPKRSR